MDDPLRPIDAAVNRFINKVNKRNEPLEAFRQLDLWQGFHDDVKAGIADQYKYARDNLSQAPKLEMAEPSAAQVTNWLDHMRTWLDHNLPSSTLHLDQNQVFDVLKGAFVYAIEGQLLRLGMLKKAAGEAVDFSLTNQFYINALNDEASYLLNTKSTAYDQTTKDRLINYFKEAKLENQTIDEIAAGLDENFDNISSVRAFMIANTETANAMGQANAAFMKENDIPTKVWVPAGSNTCDICLGNADDGEIPADQAFSSGDDAEPAHTGCECYVDAGKIDLTTVDLWDGS